MKLFFLRFLFFNLAYFSFQNAGFSQQVLPLNNLSFFQEPGPSWSIAGNVNSSFTGKDILSSSPGTGLLVNVPDASHPGKDIMSKEQFGGMDIELDYLLAPGSNSGIYLQGRYEVQLRDSWGDTNPTSADNGGIYERWDENKPSGQQGYDGHAPRQNVSRAPGLWQHMKISFQAAQFNPAGQKTNNAVMLLVQLNGVTVQENVELSGPTRGALGNDEVPLGPLRLQGDHGAVAFRSIKITPYNSPLPELTNLKYEIFKGKYEDDTGYLKAQPDIKGKAEIISMSIASFPPVFLIRFSGILRIKEAGVYHFGLGIAGGRGSIEIHNRNVLLLGQGKNRGSGEINLPSGDFPINILYSKLVTWDKPQISVDVSGPGIRNFKISDANVGAEHENPILVDAPVNTILRGFSDIDTIIVTHAVNIGTPLKVNYTYDMDKGMIVQVWRGGFLDVSTMWHGRGDGTPRPLGMVQQFGKPELALEKQNSPEAMWQSDTVGSSFRTKGYVLDENGIPEFKYLIYGNMVSDKTTALFEGQGLHRTISIAEPMSNLYFKIATATAIEKLSDNIYLMGDKRYYIRLDDTDVQPVIRNKGGSMELIVPLKKSFSYSILF